MVTSIFVYGTLQRGEEREACWPVLPLSIESAEARAAMYDVGEYPAIVPGDDRIAGELWHFRAEQMPETLKVLDAIEGFAQESTDLYRRQTINCQAELGIYRAFAYFLAEPDLLNSAQRVIADKDGLCRWHRFR